ncbi:MAG: hypothetical protein J5902_01640 [Paludibacteraceae bacterium]|nr:hypothetical protein [Paludibacteraceae bacterium]
MRKLFTFLFAALMSVSMFATTVTWNSSTLSSIYLRDGQSFTQDGVTLTVLAGQIDGEFGEWMGNSENASFKFSTSLGNFTRIEITGTINRLGGSGWTQTSPGAVWTGDANETIFGKYFENVSQIVFTIAEPAPTTYTLKLVADPAMGSVAVTNLLGSDIVDNGNGTYTVPENAKVTILATPNEGYAFTGWLEGNVLCDFIDCGVALNTLDNPLTFTMTNDAACKAEFKATAPAGEVTVVFAANNKTVERTVTLPHTFKCSWNNGMDVPDELDIIIHELYNDYYYCNSNMNASGSDQVEVGTEEAPKNDYITIKGVFEGTATVTGDYFDWITGEEGAHNYSITISIKGDEPQVERELTKLGFNFPSENIPADNDIEMAGTFEEGTMWMEKIIATGWFVSYDFVNAAEDETFKLRSKSNNDLVLCQFIPANNGEGGKWVQAIFTFGNYWSDDTWKGTPCKLIEEDLSDAAQYAWMEGMPEPQPTGIEHIVLTEKAQKVIVDGMIYIVRDGKLFNLTGAQVR